MSVEEANKLRDAYGFGQGGNKSDIIVQESKNENSSKLIPSPKGEVVKTITFEGDPDVYKMVNGEKVTSKTADVYIVDGDFDNHPEQWANIDDFSNKLHYNEQKDNPNKVDLGKGYSQTNDWSWYGPNSDFKVENVEIGKSDVYGTKIRINVLDSSGNIKGSVDMVHFTEINNEIYESSKNDVFPKGTFLGKTDRPIGVSTGPHLHVESLDRGSNRNDIYELMKGETEK
ncbi:MAG TPA: hypothetical protein PKG60_07295 [Spirochaetota bacterium]|nr:hypothetical protein [Spirochaetota bacterium]HPS86600.1 hypothetical protein [Spirochaetota bacterium]